MRRVSLGKYCSSSGSGQTRINGRELEQYFPSETLRIQAREPLRLLELTAQFDLIARVEGGGPSGQSGALRMGIARALLAYNAELRARLRAAGMLTRDSRMKERKKYGQKGARKRFQFSKR